MLTMKITALIYYHFLIIMIIIKLRIDKLISPIYQSFYYAPSVVIYVNIL